MGAGEFGLIRRAIKAGGALFAGAGDMENFPGGGHVAADEVVLGVGDEDDFGGVKGRREGKNNGDGENESRAGHGERLGGKQWIAAELGRALARLAKEVAEVGQGEFRGGGLARSEDVGEEECGTGNDGDAIEESGRLRSELGRRCPRAGRLHSGHGTPTGSLFCRAEIATGWARGAALVR